MIQRDHLIEGEVIVGQACSMRGAQGAPEQVDEALQVIIARVQGDPQCRSPGMPAALVVLLQEGGLAVAGSSADQDQFLVLGTFQLFEQALSQQRLATLARGGKSVREECRRALRGGCHRVVLMVDRFHCSSAGASSFLLE
ncbi:hypothetical protein D3C80_1216060 [compost metagenome]